MRGSRSLVLLCVVALSAGCSKPATHDATAVSAAPQPELAPAPPTPLDPLTYGQEQSVTQILLRKAACDRLEPGFRERSARAFGRWRRYRSEEIGAIESRPGFASQLAELDRAVAAGGSVDSELDSGALLAIFEDGGRPNDAQLSTPEGAWSAFLGALARADRARALACLSPAGRETQRANFAAISDETMRETGAAFVRFDLREGSGSLRTGTATRRDGTLHAVVLDRAWNGDWRITSF